MSNEEGLNIADLKANARDFAVSALKASVGIIPTLGPVAQELLGTLIPKQRLDRVVLFITKLSKAVEEAHADVAEIKEKLLSPAYSSLFYKSCVQAADAVNEERVDHIKNLFTKCISSEELEIPKYETLLSLLGKLSDAELLWLKFYQLLTYDDVRKATAFQRDKLGGKTISPNVYMGMDENEAEQEYLKAVFSSTLLALGLLRAEYDKNGKPKYKCSQLGNLIMRVVSNY